MIYKTHNCGELVLKNVNQKVVLSGWVHKTRRMGVITFVDLRDKKGITQLVFAKEVCPNQVKLLKNECVITISGLVKERKAKNLKIATGEIEIIVNDLIIHAFSRRIPFVISDEENVLEKTRLKYRYLDLRRNFMQKNLKKRHQVVKLIRDFFDANDFIEVETPILTKPTFGGAKNFLVSSRVKKDAFYALAESPQMFKQLLMIGGIEKYYQIAKCFRDEDARSDRQIEFTQLDIEVSFLSKEKFQFLIEKMLQFIYQKTRGINLKTPFLKMSYQQALDKFGSDKPDLRFGIPLVDVTYFFANSKFNVFAQALEINMIVFPQILDQKILKKAEKIACDNKANGLLWVHVLKNDIVSPIKKFCQKEIINIIKVNNIKVDSTIVLIAGEKMIVKLALGGVRKFLADKLKIYDEQQVKILWIEDWPLFELNDEGKVSSAHHPFTAPTQETKDKILSKPLAVKALAYDLVINGNEIGGGSVRITDHKILHNVFQTLGLNQEEIQDQFGYFLEAFEYGIPPHCGIAFGLERLIMVILTNSENIKDFIAFPKTSSGLCLMSKAPSIQNKN